MKLVNGYEHEDDVFEETLVTTLPNGVALRHKTDNSSQERMKRTNSQTKPVSNLLTIKDHKTKRGQIDSSRKHHVGSY